MVDVFAFHDSYTFLSGYGHEAISVFAVPEKRTSPRGMGPNRVSVRTKVQMLSC